MDAITSTSEEENLAIDDGEEPMTEDLLLGEKRKLDVGEENEEKKQEICVVSEQNEVKGDMLDDDAALYGDENQTESSSPLDERGDEDDDTEMTKWEMEELEKEMKELAREELEKERKELEWEEFQWVMDEYCMEFREKQKKDGKQRGKGKAIGQKQGSAKTEARFRASQGIDVPMMGEKRTRDHQDGKKSKSKDLKVGSSIERTDSSDAARFLGENLKIEETEPIEIDERRKNKYEDERREKSESETIINLLDRSLKENWEDLSDEGSTSLEASNKEIVPEVSKLNEPGVKSVKKDSVKLRSPVICVLGHVDAGKTKLLDFIRKTHVQDAEAGGITQQIGATMIPQEALHEKCKMANDFSTFDLKLPGLLVIDTPGHESFRNLRSRGTSMCDIAILVVDIMHGLETQTIESVNLLRDSKTPFIVALNKVDRLYGWKSSQDSDVESTVKRQDPVTKDAFKKRCEEVIVQFAEEYINAVLFYENSDPRTFVSMVPTSAISGDGMGNLMSLIAKLAQTRLHKSLVFSQELKATVLEVKAIPGLGTTVDVILVNGRLNEGDTIVMGGRDGPIVGQIRTLLTPHPLKEMRVKNQYVQHKSIEGAQGVKITGKDLEKAIAGLPLFVARKQSDVEPLKEKASALIEQVVSRIKTSDRGVYVQASTLGSLEAFLEYLTSKDIPYFALKIGPVVKKDVSIASVMVERDIQYATILAFDVKVEKEAQEYANVVGVRIIASDHIYRAGEEFLKHREKFLKEKEEALSEAVFPCICQVPTSGKKSFVVLVKEGYLRLGTPLLARNRKNLEIGVVTSISAVDGSSVDMARAGDEVTIEVETAKEPVQVRAEDRLISRISKKSFELCKKYCKNDFSDTEWDLLFYLRKESNSLD